MCNWTEAIVQHSVKHPERWRILIEKATGFRRMHAQCSNCSYTSTHTHTNSIRIHDVRPQKKLVGCPLWSAGRFILTHQVPVRRRKYSVYNLNPIKINQCWDILLSVPFECSLPVACKAAAKQSNTSYSEVIRSTAVCAHQRNKTEKTRTADKGRAARATNETKKKSLVATNVLVQLAFFCSG